MQSLWLTFAQLAPFSLGFIMHRILGTLDTYGAFGLLDKLSFATILGGTGMMQALYFFCGKNLGQGNEDGYKHSLANGLFLAFFLAVSLSTLIYSSGVLFRLIGIDPHLSHLTDELAPFMAIIIVPTMILAPIKIHLVLNQKAGHVSFLFAFGAMVGAILCYFVMEREDLNPLQTTQGILLAGGIANSLILLASIPFCLGTRVKFPGPFLLSSSFSWQSQKEIISMGWPISGVILLENFAILLSLFMIGTFWPQYTAIHTIALLWVSIGLLVSLGVSQAIVQRISILWSQGELLEGRRFCLVAIMITLGFSTALMYAFSYYPYETLSLFHQREFSGIEVKKMVPFFMMQAGILCTLQSLIIVLAAILRGIGQTRAPLVQALLGYGIFGGLSQYLFAFSLAMGATGLWFGMNLGFAITVLILFRKVVEEINLFRIH
ncbi:MATE family efflux transporter [Pseudobacteriovorax antillogorgiicola]|nr:MATE family efflux transporter [Pseudobacteriovorax antillogorgiicola]